MSKFTNYLKENRNDIALAMMSANAMLTGIAPDWKLMAEMQERK